MSNNFVIVLMIRNNCSNNFIKKQIFVWLCEFPIYYASYISFYLACVDPLTSLLQGLYYVYEETVMLGKNKQNLLSRGVTTSRDVKRMIGLK